MVNPRISTRTQRRVSRDEALKSALVADGFPFTAFLVDDIQAEYQRLKDAGVEFTMEPTNMGTTIAAILMILVAT